VNGLREQIRSILREELAGLRASTPAPAVQTVRIETDSDLLHFARTLVARAQEPGFAEHLAAGRVRFTLERARHTAPTFTQGVSPPVPQPQPWQNKTLLTEKDIAALGSEQRVLHVCKQCRLTPLAQDEARRRGIRIERKTT